MQWVVKYSSILSYMLEPPSLLTQGFNKNKKAQENLFNDMCNFGARAEWSNGRRDASSYLDVDISNGSAAGPLFLLKPCVSKGRRDASSYLDVDISNGQYRLVNLTPLECIAGSTMEDAIDDRYLKRMHQRRLNIIDGSISSYCSILNSPERLHMIKQANEFASVLCDIESDRLGEKEDRKKRAMDFKLLLYS